MALFSAREVTKQYASHKALDQVSIEVMEGTIFGLLGPNGAGKTTLIRIINQILAPDHGTLWFRDQALRPEDIARIGYLPEERGLYKKMSVGEQAVYLARLKGLSHQDATRELRHWFEKFEIKGWWNRKVEELSKGMQQKVQFLITIIHKPELLIFDEPFSGFDPINANLLKEEILAQKASGTTIIFSTHNMASVEELCDDIALIDHSRVVLAGSMTEIKQQYSTNTFRIGFNHCELSLGSILPERYSFKEEERSDNLRFATISLPEGTNSNDLIRGLIDHVTLHSFEEVIPSMNDIFIRVVAGGELNPAREEQP